jgi:hypothetical protein
MSADLSATGLILRYTMIVMVCAFGLLAYWKIPALNLDLQGTLIGWGVVLATCAQFATAAVLAKRVPHEEPLQRPVVISNIVGLFIFLGVQFTATRLEGIVPSQLNLILMLGVNAMAAAMLTGLLLTPKPPEETENAE